MRLAETSRTLVPGDHCRFCPAKRFCPALQGMFEAAANADGSRVSRLSNEMLALEYKMLAPNRIYAKAVEEEVYRRNTAGNTVPGTKLVAMRANRVWKDGAEVMLEMTYGADAFTPPELKSPAVMEKMGPVAKDLVKEYAYTPQAGMTVVLATDDRPEIKVTSMAEAFKDVDVSDTVEVF
jgi:hypothetical protein